MRETYTQALFRMLSELLGTPEGLLFVAFSAVVLVLMGAVPRLRWFALAVALWVSTLGFVRFHGDYLYHDLPFPIQQIRALREVLSVALMALLVLMHFLVLRNRAPIRSTLFYGGSLVYFILHLYIVFRHALAGDVERGGWGLIIYVITFLAIPVVLARWVAAEGHVRNLLLAVVFFGIIFTLGNVYSIITHRSHVIWGGRLFGTTGNANHLAQMIGLVLLPTIFLASSVSVNKLFKMFLYAIAGTQLMLLFASGSRTGLVIVAVATMIFFRARLGRFFVTGMGVAIALGIAVMVAGDTLNVGGIFGRLTLDADTRTGAWTSQWEHFSARPLTGTIGYEEARGFSENSYLLAGARYGIVAFLLLLLVVGVFTAGALHAVILTRRHQMSPEWQKLADLALAGVVSLAAGGVFEGYLMGNLAPGYMMFYVYGIMIVFIRQAAYAAGPTMDRLPEMGRLPAVALS